MNQQKLQAQLDLREKQLKAREEYLDSIEPSLEKAKLKLDVLEGNILARENHYNQIVEKHKTAQARLDALQSDYDDKRKKLQLKHEEALKSHKNTLDKYTEAKEQLNKTHKERIHVENEIKDLKRYQAEQQELVNKAINDGNTQLLSLKYEVDDLYDQKKRIENQISQAITDKTEYEYKLSLAQTAFDRSVNSFTTQQEGLNDKIDDLQKELRQAAAKLEMTNKEIDHKLSQLQEKESSILAKQDALILDRQEFETEKRRFESLKNLYDNV